MIQPPVHQLEMLGLGSRASVTDSSPWGLRTSEDWSFVEELLLRSEPSLGTAPREWA